MLDVTMPNFLHHELGNLHLVKINRYSKHMDKAVLALVTKEARFNN